MREYVGHRCLYLVDPRVRLEAVSERGDIFEALRGEGGYLDDYVIF